MKVTIDASIFTRQSGVFGSVVGTLDLAFDSLDAQLAVIRLEISK